MQTVFIHGGEVWCKPLPVVWSTVAGQHRGQRSNGGGKQEIFDIFPHMVVAFHHLPPAPHPAAQQALFAKGGTRYPQPGDNNSCEENSMEKDLPSLCELAFAMEEDDAALGGN